MAESVAVDEGAATPKEGGFAAAPRAPRVRAKTNAAKPKPRRTRAAPRPKAKTQSQSKPRPKVAAKARVKPAPAPPPTWIAQFIYAGPDGGAKLALMTITAESAEAARAFAAAHPPAEEFLLSIHLRSDEQFLGQVRLKALAAAARLT